MKFSIIIPVYDRPFELDELLKSIAKQPREIDFEVVVIEDGSKELSDTIVKEFETFLDIKYYYKENSGPGHSRNYGMKKATGDYYIIVDSDCLLPLNYLYEVNQALNLNYTDGYGGPDTTHESFTSKQKAINYSMTSILTTGGIRGSNLLRNKFQLRSFNMGISKKAFIKTKGFSRQRIGEDIDLTFNLWACGFETQYIPKAFVYHKRRSTWGEFLKQTFNFGAARPILNKMHPNSFKITYWFPSIFVFGLLLSLLGWLLNSKLLIILYGFYFLIIFTHCWFKTRDPLVALYSMFATFIQFIGYGIGFLRSTFRVNVLKLTSEQAFSKMFGL